MRSLSTKIVALSFAAALAAGLVGGGVLIAIMLDVSGAQIRSLEAALRANFDRNARTEVETAVSLLAAVEKVAGRAGAEAAARKLAADLVRELRYDKTGYFWIDDAKGNNIVLLGTTASEDRELREGRSAAERAILAALTLVLPPHRDNIRAARYLAEEVGRDDPAVEWVAVRPDGLVDAATPSPYELYEAPRRSPLFDPGKTSRINVAAFMAELLAKGELWETWKGRMPVIYDAGQAAGRGA